MSSQSNKSESDFSIEKEWSILRGRQEQRRRAGTDSMKQQSETSSSLYKQRESKRKNEPGFVHTAVCLGDQPLDLTELKDRRGTIRYISCLPEDIGQGNLYDALAVLKKLKSMKGTLDEDRTTIIQKVNKFSDYLPYVLLIQASG